MDELVLTKVVKAVDSGSTLAALACSCRLLRRLVAEEQAARAHCPELRRLLGHVAPADGPAQARAAALSSGAFRRQFLADIAEAQAKGIAYDGRQQSYDLVSLPGRGACLEAAELAATDRQHLLLYSADFRILAALSFVDRPAGAPPASLRQPRLFCSVLTSVLVRAPLRLGLAFLEPPLLLGAADFLLAGQLEPTVREELGALADAAHWQRCFGPDDDVHILWQSLTRRLPTFSLAAGSLHGCLDSSFVRTVMANGRHMLRYCDVSGNAALSDAAIAMLLALCPQLRTLHAIGSNLGMASLAALVGRHEAQEQERNADVTVAHGRSEQRRQAGLPRAAAAHGTSHSAAAQAAEALGSLHLGPSRHAAPPGRHADAGAAAGAANQPACPLLECLSIGGSGCRVKGSALRRALRCLPRLTDLRLHGCSLNAVLDPLVPPAGHDGKASSSSSSGSGGSKVEALGRVLRQLTRLEALDAPDLAPPHVVALLQHCTSLRRLALSSKLLAEVQFDRQQHGSLGGGSSSGSSSGWAAPGMDGDLPLPSLVHLEVGWGTGGTFLVHLAQRHGAQLASLTAHAGAAVSDGHLAMVAASCRHLARLCLRGSNVSDKGVATVLERCPRLTSLQLSNCVGPLTDRLGAACSQRRGAAFRLQELRLGWAAGQLSDTGLAALLHPAVARLRSLELKGCSSLTDAAWALIAQHGGTLECLAVEYCGAGPRMAKSAAPQGGGQPPMTAGAAVEALTSCRTLLALTVRSCTPVWTAAEVERLRAGCPALQTLALDA